MTTAIEWTWVTDGKGGRKKGETWNPQIGCSEISPGCRNCYAAKTAHRGLAPQWIGTTVKRSNGVHWNGVINPVPHLLDQPLRWRAPRGIFVGSMTDIFHESRVATEDGRNYIAAIFGIMAACHQHTFMILTKRPDRMREWFEWVGDQLELVGPAIFCASKARQAMSAAGRARLSRAYEPGDVWPLPNVILMTTTEDQPRADERIPDLLACPAAVHGLSVEPLLGQVDLSAWIGPSELCIKCGERSAAQEGDTCPECKASDCLTRQWGADFDDDPRLDWVITGGESGPNARPSHPDWFRSLRDQCTEAGVAHFFKQWGEWATGSVISHLMPEFAGQMRDFTIIESSNRKLEGTTQPVAVGPNGELTNMVRVGKKTAGRELDGREWSEFPDV